MMSEEHMHISKNITPAMPSTNLIQLNSVCFTRNGINNEVTEHMKQKATSQTGNRNYKTQSKPHVKMNSQVWNNMNRQDVKKKCSSTLMVHKVNLEIWQSKEKCVIKFLNPRTPAGWLLKYIQLCTAPIHHHTPQ